MPSGPVVFYAPPTIDGSSGSLARNRRMPLWRPTGRGNRRRKAASSPGPLSRTGNEK